MTQVLGYAAKHAISDLRLMNIERSDPVGDEVTVDIAYCGICHSDVHQCKNEWKNTLYPCMPGHEITGVVSAIGQKVTRYKLGDKVAVGCMVSSCGECSACRDGLENYCEKGFTATYNGNMRTPIEANHTYGGYSASIVVRQDFVFRVPDNMSLSDAAPIVCAGVTTYSPMRHWKIGPGTQLGIIGFGGLGQIAVQLGKALGARVTVLTTSPEKREDALQLGAADLVVSTDEAQMEAHAAKLDFILSTIPQPHDANLYMPLLKREGIYTVVGCIAPLTAPLDLSKMITDRRSLATSLIGSRKETQEVLDFCAKHGIKPVTKLIPVDGINDAFKHVDAGDVDFRYVIDMATLAGKHEDDSLAAKVGL